MTQPHSSTSSLRQRPVEINHFRTKKSILKVWKDRTGGILLAADGAFFISQRVHLRNRASISHYDSKLNPNGSATSKRVLI